MTTHGDHPRTEAQTRADELRTLAGPVESGTEGAAGTSDAPDARTDPDVDEVREGGEGEPGEHEEYGLRSMPDSPNPTPGDPASQMNF